MTEEVQYKQLPKFDQHVDYWQMHNAASEAVIQLQLLVHELRQEVASLKSAETTGKGASRASKTASK